MGLLDLPAPVFAWIDQELGGPLPSAVRLVLWAAVAAAVSMASYELLSPQARIARTKAEQKRVRRALDECDGDLADAWPLLRRMLRSSLGQVALALPAAVAASLPVLCLLAWLSTAYGYALPAFKGDVPLETGSSAYFAHWQDAAGPAAGAPEVVVTDLHGRKILRLELTAPAAAVHKRKWWNTLLGNPAGYLPEDAPLERVEIGLPRREVLPFGPSWVRTWEPVFFAAMVACSLAIKTARRIE